MPPLCQESFMCSVPHPAPDRPHSPSRPTPKALPDGAAASADAWPARIGRRVAAAAITLVAALGAACTSLPAADPPPPSAALAEVGHTPLARLVAASTPAPAQDRSGFRLLADGADALATRMALARRAQRSLDVQYYQIAADTAGRQFLAELRDAARRGVRVRLLVDDLNAADLEPLLRSIDALDQIEVRLFNPLPVRGGTVAQRLLLSLHEFARINRRMHNKLFIADNSIAVVGGRNIGDEYFMRAAHAHFIDMDVLATGVVVRELSSHFDAFWNDRLAMPIGQLARAPSASAAQGLLQTLAAASLHDTDAEGGTAAQIGHGRLDLHFARAQVFADGPEKAAAFGRPAVPGRAMERSLQLMQSAHDEVLIASPYFVPGAKGLALMREAIGRGVGVAVLTNSLGATDEPLAHVGYARYRLDMLRIGVDLAELSPTAQQAEHGALRSSLGRLHAKLAVVDRRWLLVGSMNMDIRSSRLNTEISLAIESTELADEVAALLRRQWSERNYRLRLADDLRRIEWQSGEAGRIVRHAREPHADWWLQWRLALMSMFVPEEQL
jgi:putative cardiolipin synthase